MQKDLKSGPMFQAWSLTQKDLNLKNIYDVKTNERTYSQYLNIDPIITGLDNDLTYIYFEDWSKLLFKHQSMSKSMCMSADF